MLLFMQVKMVKTLRKKAEDKVLKLLNEGKRLYNPKDDSFRYIFKMYDKEEKRKNIMICCKDCTLRRANIIDGVWISECGLKNLKIYKG